MAIASTPISLEDIAESWMADHDLLPQEREALEAIHEETLRSLPLAVDVDIAPGHVCTEVDLRPGATWVEVEAAILDDVQGTGTECLRSVQRLLDDFGLPRLH